MTFRKALLAAAMLAALVLQPRRDRHLRRRPDAHLRDLRDPALRHLDQPRPLRPEGRHRATDKAAKTGKVDITFQIGSVNTGVAAMNTHLKGDDFFSADKFPTAQFVGDKFTFDGAKVTAVSAS